MSTFGRYCKAYPTERLKAYSGIAEKLANQSDSNSPSTPEYLFLHENFMLTKGICQDEDIVFADQDPEWEKFCMEQLGFSVPEFCRDRKVEEAA